MYCSRCQLVAAAAAVARLYKSPNLQILRELQANKMYVCMYILLSASQMSVRLTHTSADIACSVACPQETTVSVGHFINSRRIRITNNLKTSRMHFLGRHSCLRCSISLASEKGQRGSAAKSRSTADSART